LWLRPALVPVMVKEFGVVLAATVSPTSRVIVAEAPEAVGVTGGGAKQLTPAGIELQPSATGWLKPFPAVRFSLKVVVPPGSTLWAGAAKLMVKSLVCGGGATENALATVLPKEPEPTSGKPDGTQLVTVTLRGPGAALASMVTSAVSCVEESSVQEFTRISAPKLHTKLTWEFWLKSLPVMVTFDRCWPGEPELGSAELTTGIGAPPPTSVL